MRAASPSPSLQQGNAGASPHISLLGSSPPVGHASGPASHLDATQGLGVITGPGPDSQAFDLGRNGRGDFGYSIVDRPSAQRGSPNHRGLGRVQSQRRSSSLSEYYPRTSMPSPRKRTRSPAQKSLTFMDEQPSATFPLCLLRRPSGDARFRGPANTLS
jgi:hypothetical protein